MAEVCELVGLYLLSHLKQITPTNQAALYRYDYLAIVENCLNVQMERICKRIRIAIKNVGFKITIESGMIKIDF